MEKSFFALLNKLFEIEVFERNHKVFLLYKNLLAFINEPKSFIMPVFTHVAPSFLVPDKHFVLKNLSFYAVARMPGPPREAGEESLGRDAKANSGYKSSSL